MKIADYGKAITSYIESPTTAKKLQAKEKAQTLGRTFLAEGSEDIVEPSKSMKVDTTTKGLDLFTIEDFKDKAEIYVGAYHNNALPTADIKSALNKFTQKGIDDGTFSADDAIKIVQDLKFQFQDRAQKQRLRDVIIEGTGTVEREEFGEGTKTKLVEFIEKFKLENNRPPTIMEVADGAKSSTASIRKYLEEGVDFVKTDLSEVGKKGGTTSGAAKKTGVTKLDSKAYKELQDLRIKGVSFQVDTGVGGSKGVRVTIQDPNVSKAFFGDRKTLSFTADAKGIEQAKNLVKQVAISEVYKDNVLPFQTDEYKRKIKRLKAAQYKLRDPFRVYEKLQEYKTKIFPGNLSKEIQIQHGDAKFTTQTLSRMGLIDAAANISPAVEKAERLRNNALKIAMSTLDNPNASVAAKRAAAEKYNSIAKGLRGQLKGTEGQGLINFQLLEVDDSGKYKKLKDISFNPKKGLVDSDLDLSKITKEQADDLIAQGKKKLDIEAVKLKTGVTTADKIQRPEKALLSDKFKTAFTKGAKTVGKVIKPVGYAFGANAVKNAVSKADDMGIELSLADKIIAFDSGDADIAINNYKRRNDPEFAAAERARDLAKMTDDFEEVGQTTFGKYNDQIKNIKLP